MTTKPDYNKLYTIAEAQGGYFTTQQARGIGFSYERLSNNVKTGRFMRVTHGIYRLTHFPNSPFEDLFIAGLRTGPQAAISHDSALAVFELSDALPAEVHVTVPRGASRRRAGIRQHTAELKEHEITSREGLRVTSVARTIADVAAAGLAEDLVRQAIKEALERGMVSVDELRRYAVQRGGRFRGILGEVDFDRFLNQGSDSNRSGPTRTDRDEILRIAKAHGAYNVRIFGSHARGEGTEDSDLDILVALEPDRSILDLIAIKQDLEDGLEREIDVVTEASLSPYIREQVLKEAVPL